MERHQLEDQIRASLQSRAEDVRPTPELWERVSERTSRRARWTVGLWALSGAAAVVAVVFGGMALFDTPRNIQIQPEPDVMDSPDGVVPAPSTGPTVVTTDGQSLFEVDPATGEVVRELDPFAGFAEPATIGELAVRPGGDRRELTIATVIEVEGTYDVEVSVFDDAGQRTDRQRVGMAAPDASGLPPDVVWSQDGRYVMWAGTGLADGAVVGPSLWAYDWVERPVDDDGVASASRAVAEGAGAALFEGSGTVDLRGWTGAPEGASFVTATTTTGRAYAVALTPGDNCGVAAGPCFEVSVSDLGFEGLSPIDLGVLDTGVDLALVARPGPAGDAEGATLELVAGPMGDAQHTLDVPDLTPGGTAAPLDGWLAVAGDRVAVGFGGQVHLLTLEGDVIEDTRVVDTVALPSGTTGAALVGPGAGTTPGAEPSSAPATETVPAAVGQDGVPVHVLTGGADGQLELVDRRAPDEPLARIDRPEGVDQDMSPGDLVVHPASTATDLHLVTSWSVGESQVLARTVVRDGEVVANAVLDDSSQPRNRGGAAETAHSSPVFSPTGEWLAWIEAPEGGAGAPVVRILEWSDEGPSGADRTLVAPDAPSRPFHLLDWASAPGGDVLTMAPASDPTAQSSPPTELIVLHLRVADGTVVEPTDDDWEVVELPGALLDAGSYQFEDGAERYVLFDGGDEAMYGLVEAPDVAVPTGAAPFGEGRVVAFGPDSALVQRAGGGWQRVQVDTGAATAVRMPAGTRAVLPWRG